MLVHTLATKLSVNVYTTPPDLVCELILDPLLVHTRPPHGTGRARVCPGSPGVFLPVGHEGRSRGQASKQASKRPGVFGVALS